MKKKILTLLLLLLSISKIYAQDISIKNDWQLLGAIENINISKLNNSCIDFAWKYDTSDISNPQWQVHIANGQDYDHNYPNISYLSSSNGFWVKGNSDCNITTNTTVYNNTSRSGFITSDEYWSGTITVTADIVIQEGGSVIIKPGTTVKFTAGLDAAPLGDNLYLTTYIVFPDDPDIYTDNISTINLQGGSLYSVGTQENPIIFTTDSSTPDATDWHGLVYGNSDSIMNIQHTTIEYAFIGIGIIVPTNDKKITIKNNTIRHVVGCGVCVNSQPEPVYFTVSDNDFSDCGHEAIDTHGNINLTIENNIFHDNSGSYGDSNLGGTGVVIVDGDNNSTIRNNTFINNATAINIVTDNNNPTISGNTFTNNGQDCMGFCPN